MIPKGRVGDPHVPTSRQRSEGRGRRRTVRRSGPLLIIAASLGLLIGACAQSTAERDEAIENERARLELVATDMAHVLAQLLSAPEEREVVIAGGGPFADAITGALGTRGIRVRRSEGDEGEGRLRYRLRVLGDEIGQQWRARVGVRSIVLERDYRIEGERIVPTSSLRLWGAAETRPTLAAALFEGDENGQRALAEQRDLEAPPPPRGRSATDAPATLGREGWEPDIELLAGFLAEHTIEFGRGVNDRSALVPYETMLDELAEQARHERGFVDVLGCSQGRTTMPGGNARLARDRAELVGRAFEQRGVSGVGIDRSERCVSAGVNEPSLPTRGVRIRLLQRPVEIREGS